MRVMDFSFEVGTVERHSVRFRFSQFFGNLRIDVDGSPALRTFRLFSLYLTESFHVEVGERERHHVSIEKTRKIWLAGLRRQTYRVLVDGVPIIVTSLGSRYQS